MLQSRFRLPYLSLRPIRRSNGLDNSLWKKCAGEKSCAPDRAIRISYSDPGTSVVEAVLSRTGRRAFDLIENAWKHGARFDAWTDQFDYDRWVEAGREVGMDLERIAAEPYELDVRLPWEHTSPGVSRGFLEREWRRAELGVTTPDCTRATCTGCGVCPTLGVQNDLAGERG